MKKEEVLQQVIESGALPTLSTVASKLISLTAKEETTIFDITKLIAQDISLSAKVLKVVNSAFYNFPNEVGSIQQAVAILGTNAVRSLVLSFSFLSMEHANEPGGFSYEEFWERSLAAGVSAKLLMAKVCDDDTEEVFTVSLLANLGKLILATAFAERYSEIYRQASNCEQSLSQLEAKVIGAVHAYVGREAAHHWNFPTSLTQPILYHHDPDTYPGDDPLMKRNIEIIYLAGLLTNILYSGKPIDYHRPFREQAKKRFALDDEAIDDLLQRVNVEVAQAAEFFGISIGGTASIPELLQEANIELSLLNMSYEQMNRELVQAKMKLEKMTSELEEKNTYLESIANLDGLTEVYNHRYFQNFLEKELNRSLRRDLNLSLILCDIDNFKKFNDFHGHQVGDFVLKEVCRVCGEHIREYDLLARYGGEEFVFVLPDTGSDEAMIVAEKLREGVEKGEFFFEKMSYRVTISFGVASLPKGGRIKRSELIEAADKALYQAKKKGRNRVEMYQEKSGWFRKKS
ncbi:MAG: GGDEF domain-containing protein [Geopsychrobacter sp.]|nr:GGDEF domain-containing protein [Geopsychrobacter sp.]